MIKAAGTSMAAASLTTVPCKASWPLAILYSVPRDMPASLQTPTTVRPLSLMCCMIFMGKRYTMKKDVSSAKHMLHRLNTYANVNADQMGDDDARPHPHPLDDRPGTGLPRRQRCRRFSVNLLHCTKCPGGHKTDVVESRRRTYGDTITVLRVRRCPVCGVRHRTVEVPAEMAADLFEDD